MDFAGARRQAPALTFALIAALAFVFYTFVYGADLQVGDDDLRLLTGQQGSLLNQALDAYAVHWSTVPYFIGRCLYAAFGLQTVQPWIAVGAASWVAGAALVRVLARQSGARPWPATIAASAVLTCSAIYPQSQPHSFQVPLSVAFGLAAVACAASSAFGWSMAFGLLALMTGGAAVPFVVACAAVLWIRGATKNAVIMGVTLGGIYVLWYWRFGTHDAGIPGPSLVSQPVTKAIDWMITGTFAGFMGLGHWWAIAFLLLVVTVVGAALPWLHRCAIPPRSAAISLVVVGAGLLHLLLTYVLRFQWGAASTSTPRYLYVTVLTLAPLIAVAMSALTESCKPFSVLPALLVIGAIGNLIAFPDIQRDAVALTTAQAQRVAQLGTSPLLDQVPGWVKPQVDYGFGDGLGDTTVDFLREARDTRRLPTVAVWEDYNLQIPVRLGFANTFQPVPAGADCRARTEPFVVDGPVGSRVGLQAGGLSDFSPIRVALVSQPRSEVTLASWQPSQFEVTLPGPYVISPSDPAAPFLLCTW